MNKDVDHLRLAQHPYLFYGFLKNNNINYKISQLHPNVICGQIVLLLFPGFQ
jgi:hypothetical protein